MLRSPWWWRPILAVAVVLMTFVVAGELRAQNADPGAAPGKIFLHQGWEVQSSCVAKEGGEKISLAGFDAGTWHKTDIPATVVGVLVTDKTYPDPNYGKNLKSLPGMDYSDKTFFANQDMPKDSPFKCSWWYRTEFPSPAAAENVKQRLHFLGINYRANIWVNGKKLAAEKDVTGTYRTFEFDVTKYLENGKTNGLAVEISAPKKNDLGITWVDWNPTPPDKNMGIWKEVFLSESGDVSVRNPFVRTKLSKDNAQAALTVTADLRNVSGHAVSGVLKAEIEGAKISQPVTLNAGEGKTVRFAPEQFAELKVANPKLWWPYAM